MARRLDRGRLCAQEVTDSSGSAPNHHWPLTRAGRAGYGCVPAQRLEATGAAVPVAGTHRAHTDKRCQVVITSGLRAHLAVRADGVVIARVVDDQTIEILTSATLANTIEALDMVAAAVSRTTIINPAQPVLNIANGARR